MPSTLAINQRQQAALTQTVTVWHTIETAAMNPRERYNELDINSQLLQVLTQGGQELKSNLVIQRPCYEQYCV